ncbi:MAG: acyl carrier protein [Rhodospirillaceae bacterium]|nr:acyl carrier protein [Rhodospirillaceae bacterium]
MADKNAIFEELSQLLADLFELDPKGITLESRLYEDLELDSIDAVDLVVHLQKKTSKKIKPEMFKAVRTVGDVVDVVATLIDEP